MCLIFEAIKAHAEMANFLGLKLSAFLAALVVLKAAWCLERPVLLALVDFHLRSFGVCLDFLYLSLASVLFFSLSTVRTLAMAFLTTYIKK